MPDEFTAIDHVESTVLLPRTLQRALVLDLLRSWLAGLNAVETDLTSISDFFDAQTAAGTQLETLARYVDVSPNAGPEDVVRLLVQTEVLVLRSRGSLPDLLGLVDRLFPNGDAADVTETPPAALVVGPVFSTTLELATAAADQVERAASAGVRTSLTWTDEADADTFQFASGDVVEVDASRGFANDGGTVGGSFVDVI